jgi:trans-aconitate methyltransferase
MIDRALIDEAFARCLQRPVSDEAAYEYFTSLGSVEEVYECIFTTPEFRNRIAPLPDDVGVAPQEVEVDAAPEVLARMVAHVEATWTQLGEREPHWSVITDPRFKQEQIGGHRGLYREWGRLDEEHLPAAAARAGVDLSRRQTCFELVCGTGRVTEWLARRFPRVVAADISRAHLAVAEGAIAEAAWAEAAAAEKAAGATPARALNVTFLHLARLDDLAALPEYDVLYSRIVLQHNPPPLIAMILARLLAGLAPGGVAYFQVPVWLPGYRFRVADYLAQLEPGGMEMHALPQRRLLQIVQDAGCMVRDLVEDPLGPLFGGVSNTLLVEKASAASDRRGRLARALRFGETFQRAGGSP